ncbi:MAG: zf-HC2 domain-containing protein, partial [Oscillospiraceae bacterium]|nr:zf-HC2 domain-containing protein [Oscillospiraceae bacterium]
MNCEEFHGLISGRIDGENTEEENRRLDAHLEACEDCRELLAALTQTQADIFALREAPPADLTQRIMQTVQSAPRKRQRNARKSFFFGSAATALVACAVFALIALGKIPLPHLADKKDAAVAEAAPQSAALGSGDSVMKYAQLNDSLLYGCAVAPGSNSGASLPAPFESDRLYGTEESTEFAPNESESSGEPTESFVSRGLITPAVNAPLMVFWNADPANLSLLDNLAPVGGESEK